MSNPRVRISGSTTLVLAVLVLVGMAGPVVADVITDWNEKLLPIVTSYSLSAPPYRDLAMIHVAMFQCVNVIEPRHEPYKGKLEAAPTASKEAAAAVAAATVLSKLHPDAAEKVDGLLKDYLAQITEGPAKSDGIAL